MDQPAEAPANESRNQARWRVGIRLGLSAAGAALVSFGLARRGRAGMLAGAIGAGCLLSALLAKPAWHIPGVGARRNGVEIHKTLEVDAPIEEVFELWRDFQNVPRFMRHVSEITQLDEERSRWVVEGPAGTPIEWDAELTVCLPNELLGWKTLPGQLVEQAGTIGFAEAPEGKTRVDIQMSYSPPAGVLGRLVILLSGVDPRTLLDMDLIELQALLEGRRPAAGEAQKDLGAERARGPSPDAQPRPPQDEAEEPI